MCAFVCTFRSWKHPYYKKLKKNCVWLSSKRNFLIKVAFWAQAKIVSKTRKIYKPPKVHKSKCAYCYRWVDDELRKCPDISHASHRAATNTAPPLPIYHHNQQNPFQHLIFQTQNQQNQTKNNSKSTQKQLKINSNSIGKPIANPTQNQPKTKSTQNQTQNPPKILMFQSSSSSSSSSSSLECEKKKE